MIFLSQLWPLKSWLLVYFFLRKEVSLKVGMQDKSFRGKREIIQQEGRIHYDKGQVREMATAFLKAKPAKKLNLQ